jgi:succinyl-diaminopimelate desuccinylase
MESTILDLLKQLVSIESIDTKKENLQKVIDVAKKELSGYTIEEFNQNGHPSILAYAGSTRPDKFEIILNAHLDVVSGRPDQFIPVENDGRLYGRGVSDMKGGAAAELCVFKDIAKKLPYPIALQLVTDEEMGGYDGTLLQIKSGVHADFVIAGEPTDYGINNKAKGIIWMNVKSTGTVAHGAYQWKGESAILNMKKAMDAIEKEYPVLSKEEWRTTVNIASLETTNTTYNKVPDNCMMRLDIRFVPEEWKTIKAKLEQMFTGLTCEFLEVEPPQITDENNSYVKALSLATKKITGKSAPIIVKHGGSDIRHYNGVHEDGVTWGPIGAGLHSDTEWADIQSLGEYYTILKEFLLALPQSSLK